MHIEFPAEPGEILWEGLLEPPQVMRGAGLPRVVVRKPAEWSDDQLVCKGWQPPLGGGRYRLVRFLFTIFPQGRGRVASADFCLALHPQGGQQALVYDAFPRERLVDVPLPVKIGLSPSLKFETAEAALASLETTLDFGWVVPVLSTDGLGSRRFCWHYAAHPRRPIAADHGVFAVIHLPQGIPAASLTLDLRATQEDRFGPLTLATPETARGKLQCTIGLERA